MAGKSREVNLACVVKEHLHEELSAWSEGSSQQKSEVESAGLHFGLLLEKMAVFSPVSPSSSLPMFEKGSLSADSRAVTDRRTGLRAARRVHLTFKKKDVS